MQQTLSVKSAHSLDKKWKEVLFAASFAGPNLMMVLMGAFFSDAINPVALMSGKTMQAIIPGVCLILPWLFPVLWAIAKAFDGLIDIPFASISDNLSTRWGRRRPAILVCAVPMIVSFAMCWWPVGGADNQLFNTIWITVWALVFFATYSMCGIAFYGSFASVCKDEGQNMRVSSFKSFFDTITYCVVYALVPLILDGLQVRIDKFVFCLLPVMLTIVIPLFMIREGEKYGYPERQGLVTQRVRLAESLKLTFGNRPFLLWIIVNCTAFFGLQMFLSSMNTLIIGGMGFTGGEMALINTSAFAPVPIMIYLFNKLRAKKGTRLAYQTCLLAFAVVILSFDFASLYVVGYDNKILQYVIAIIGGVIGSWAIGNFFMMPYIVPVQVARVEEKLTGKNHSAMYFAAQGVCTTIVGAIATGAIYENIKMLFISKGASGVQYAENAQQAANAFGVSVTDVYNLGLLLVPIIVSLMCLIGFFVAFKMPKDFSALHIARALKKRNPDLDISAIEAEAAQAEEEKGEILFVQIALFILSGGMFGFIWLAFLKNGFKKLFGGNGRGRLIAEWLISSFIPFASVYFTLKEYDKLTALAQKSGVKLTGNRAIHVVFGILLPLLPINIVSLAIMQKDYNKLVNAESDGAQPCGANAEA